MKPSPDPNVVRLQLQSSYIWLTSDQAQPYLREALHLSREFSFLTVLKRLRKSGLDAEQSRMIVDQVELRRRASTKFIRADRMYFTRRALQQASGENVSTYKATCFADAPAIVDYCCGIGGDLISLAKIAPSIGCDIDPVVCHFARMNCQVNGTLPTVINGPVEQVNEAGWFHFDPDRRPGGRRTTKLADSSPDLVQMEQAMQKHGSGAVKLAPATVAPKHWTVKSHRQWIGSGDECKQQVLWFGDAARQIGARSATIVDQQGRSVCHVSDVETASVEVRPKIGSYLYEPHACIIAARLVDHLANQCELHRFESDIVYLTSERKVVHRGLKAFCPIQVLPLRIRQIQEFLRASGVGHLEIKKRGVPSHRLQQLEQVKLNGDKSMILILTRRSGRHVAIACQRPPEF